MRKKLTILAIFLGVSGCTHADPACHAWTSRDLAQLHDAVAELPQENILHALIRNYEVVCAAS